MEAVEKAMNCKMAARVKIVEQPASKALRFRYECEGRSTGSLPGANSTSENKTFPTIRIEGHNGRAVVVVSCVTKDPPHRPHPHNLVGKESCRQGVCTVQVSAECRTVAFTSLGIQCVRKKDIAESLRVREEIRVDPCRTGFAHRERVTSIDLNVVRLCFQVFVEGTEKGKFNVPLAPAISDPIYDKKSTLDLVICKLSECCCTVAGGKEIILLCEKVTKEDIQVRFFEERDGQLIWQGFADFQPVHVHKQVAISFKVPRYRDLEVNQPVKVLIQLRRPSDGATSEAVPFEFLPMDLNPDNKRKRVYTYDPSVPVLRHLQAEVERDGFGPNPMKAEPVEHIQAADYSRAYRTDRGSPSSQHPSAQLYGKQLTPDQNCPPIEYAAVARERQFNIPPPYLHQQPPQQPEGRERQPENQREPRHHCRQSNELCHFQQHQCSLHAQMIPVRAHAERASAYGPMIPGTNDAVVADAKAVRGGSNMLNHDSQPCNREPSSLNQLDSGDLDFSMYVDNLSENLSSNLSISDIKVSQAEVGRNVGTDAAVSSGNGNGNNMTDSLTRLTTNTIQELCTLNNMYEPNRQHIT